MLATMTRRRLTTDTFDRLDVGYYSRHDVDLTLGITGVLTARSGSTDIVRYLDGTGRRIICTFTDDVLDSKSLLK
jgi:hypothetical protein